jgi:hypothetical protein
MIAADEDNLIIVKILELARWAPSGDNSQPWRFEIIDSTHFRIYGFDLRDEVLYDFEGHASHMAHGILLETIKIAATQFGHTAIWFMSKESDSDRRPIYDVQLNPDSNASPDPLVPFITTRTVQRRMMRIKPLSAFQKKALHASIGENIQLQFFESHWDRWRATQILWRNAKIRLTCPEAYPVHSSIVDWRSQFSKERMPDQALGVSVPMSRLMEWALGSWNRVHFLNLIFLGTFVPRFFLEFLPGLACGGHFLLRPHKVPKNTLDWVTFGSSLQRMWLTATRHGLHMQPQLTPVFFRCYVQAKKLFSKNKKFFLQAQSISRDFEKLAEAGPDDPFGFFGRLGTCEIPKSRSHRKDLKDLLVEPNRKTQDSYKSPL